MIGVGLVGYGYWGPNLLRNFQEAGAHVLAVCDKNTDHIGKLTLRHPTIHTTTDYSDLLKNPKIDAIAIATPVSTHYDLAMQALKAGKHVLVEKPLAYTSEHASQLIEEAGKRGLVLMVDHTFIYSGAVKKIEQTIADHSLGRLYYYDSIRVNLGLFQHDVNVLWDLAVHDLAIMDYVLKARPDAVSVTGSAHVSGQIANIAYMTCFFPDNLIAHFHVNWLSPVKIRHTLIGGDRKMILYDDLEPDEKVKIYDRGVNLSGSQGEEQVYQSLVNYRSGDMWAPKIDRTEPLLTEMKHFIDCVKNKKQPLTDGLAGWRVVKVLESANQSLVSGGRPVELTFDDAGMDNRNKETTECLKK